MTDDESTDATGYGMLYRNVGCSTTASTSYDFGNDPPDPKATYEKTDEPRRHKQRAGFTRSPLGKRKAERRRKSQLTKHHRKVMRMAAAGHKGPYPKRPPKPRG